MSLRTKFNAAVRKGDTADLRAMVAGLCAGPRVIGATPETVRATSSEIRATGKALKAEKAINDQNTAELDQFEADQRLAAKVAALHQEQTFGAYVREGLAARDSKETEHAVVRAGAGFDRSATLPIA